MTQRTKLVGNTGTQGAGQPARPFSLTQAKQTFEAILGRINSTKNDRSNMDISRPGQKPVASAIKLDLKEAKKLEDELALIPPGLARVILEKVLPERLKPARKGGLFLTENAARHLNDVAAARGVVSNFVAREPVL